MPCFHHKHGSGIHLHLLIQLLGRRIFKHLNAVLTENIPPDKAHGFIGIPGNHRSDHSVQPLEIHRPTHPVQEIGFLGSGRIMRTLADHLFQSIHQVVPMCLVQISGHPNNIAVFT